MKNPSHYYYQFPSPFAPSELSTHFVSLTRFPFLIFTPLIRRSFVLTTEFLQWLLRVCFTVTSFPDVIGLQLHHGLHAGQWTTTGFQVHLGKQLLAPSSWFIVHTLVPACQDKKATFYLGYFISQGGHFGLLLLYVSSSFKSRKKIWRGRERCDAKTVLTLTNWADDPRSAAGL